MLGISALCSRLLFVLVLVCAAVVPFIMCSVAGRAQVDNGVRHTVVRRLYPPNSQHHPLFTGLLALQTGTNGEIETSGNYRDASSIIYHQSNPPRFTESSFSYNSNSPDNRLSRAGTSVKSEMRPTSSYQPLSYNSHPVIIRKSSYKQAASPFHQSSSPSQAWDAGEAQKSYVKKKVPSNDSPSFFQPQTGRFRSTSLPTSRGLYGSYKETNELTSAGARSTSSGIQSSKFLGLASQIAPHAPSISSSSDAFVIKSMTPSITDFSQGLHSVSSGETPRHKKIKSYLFKDSQTALGGHETVQTVSGDGPRAFPTTPHRQRASEVLSRFSSNVKRFQQSQRKDPTNEIQYLSDNANLLYHDANVAHYGAQTDGFSKYQHTAQVSAPREDAIIGSFVPLPQADFQGNYAAVSSKSTVGSFSNTTTRRSMHASTPGQALKTIYGYRGFENPKWRAAKDLPSLSSSVSNERSNSRRYGFDKAKGFKMTNMNPPLSPKYSFGQRETSATLAKHERTTRTDYSPPSLRTHRDFTSGFKEALPWLPGSDAGVDSNPDRRRFRVSKTIYGLKGFGTRPLEGAKALVSEPDESARVQQGFEGFKLRSSEIWQPKSSHDNIMSQNEPSSEDYKPLLKTAGSSDSVSRFTPDKYNKRRKIYSFLGFPSVQNRLGNANNKEHDQNQESYGISSAYLRSAEKFKIESRPKSEPISPDKPKLFAKKASLFNSSTRSTVRGKRVRSKTKKINVYAPINETGNAAIVRLPQRPARVRTVTYADILGAASFSGVTATTQTPITTADKDDFPNTTATPEQKGGAGNLTVNSEDGVQSGGNTSRGHEAVEENKLPVRSEGVGDDMKTSDLFLDNEGSGSGGFDVADVLSATTIKSQGFSEDLSELEYLRISTGNISFKSMNLSHTGT
ncbi:uncharacterized protein LOC129093619 [Anoplopoma fimbria]|uniref:uncharacterized protein LOC129093619 n=1 Tax=Anoplopoma fimbria TaxID=229290 RepID=UPI0023ED17B3|nr:uncharacterized protein LOC129093619 [Anoplopoma fimbria]